MKAAEKSYRIHVGHVLYLVYQKTEKNRRNNMKTVRNNGNYVEK